MLSATDGFSYRLFRDSEGLYTSNSKHRYILMSAHDMICIHTSVVTKVCWFELVQRLADLKCNLQGRISLDVVCIAPPQRAIVYF